MRKRKVIVSPRKRVGLQPLIYMAGYLIRHIRRILEHGGETLDKVPGIFENSSVTKYACMVKTYVHKLATFLIFPHPTSVSLMVVEIAFDGKKFTVFIPSDHPFSREARELYQLAAS